MHERTMVGTREWILTIGVIAVPLAIAVIVTLWSLEQARYRPKRKRAPGIRRDELASENLPPSRETGSDAPLDPTKPAS